MEVGRVGGDERPPWVDVVRVVSMAVGALALVAIAFFVKDLRDHGSREDCLFARQFTIYGSGEPSDREQAELRRGCGYDVPDELLEDE